MSTIAALGFGSNIGDCRTRIAEALALLEAGGLRLRARSADYRTPPWGRTDQADFVNAAALVETGLEAEALLDLCLETEQRLGRVRAEKWGPRIIDIDLLDFGGRHLVTPRLVLPHPHLFERAFVLVPLAEIAPDLSIGGRRVGDVLAGLEPAGIRRLDPPTA